MFVRLRRVASPPVSKLRRTSALRDGSAPCEPKRIAKSIALRWPISCEARNFPAARGDAAERSNDARHTQAQGQQQAFFGRDGDSGTREMRTRFLSRRGNVSAFPEAQTRAHAPRSISKSTGCQPHAPVALPALVETLDLCATLGREWRRTFSSEAVLVAGLGNRATLVVRWLR